MTTDIILREAKVEVQGQTTSFKAEEDASPTVELDATDGRLKVGSVNVGEDVLLAPELFRINHRDGTTKIDQDISTGRVTADLIDADAVYSGVGEIADFEVGLGTPDEEDVKQRGHLKVKDEAGVPRVSVDGQTATLELGASEPEDAEEAPAGHATIHDDTGATAVEIDGGTATVKIGAPGEDRDTVDPGKLVVRDASGLPKMSLDGETGTILFRKVPINNDPMFYIFEMLPGARDSGSGSGSGTGGGLGGGSGGNWGGSGGGSGGVLGDDQTYTFDNHVLNELNDHQLERRLEELRGMLQQHPVPIVSIAPEASASGLSFERGSMVFQDDGNPVMSVGIHDSEVGGNVAIGAHPSAEHKLDVKGTIRAERVDTQSDLRLKQDVAEIEDAAGLIARLRGVSYRDGAEGDARSFGVIAQEVREVMPEAVSEDADGMLSVAYSELTPVLVEDAKAQHRRVAALEQENRDLRDALTGLEARLAQIETGRS